MPDFNQAINLDPNALVAITPVTLNEDGEVGTYGMPALIKLSDLSTFLGGNIALPAATVSTAGAVKEQANLVALTDSSTGTSGGNTIAAVTDVATAANAIATLAAKLNAVIASQKTAGQMASS